MVTVSKTLLCNRFSGIKRIDSRFTGAVITASDMQNVELFNTGIDSGVGIRTMKGNSLALALPETEKIINIFESKQKNENYFFIHTENEVTGTLYLYNPLSNVLIPKVENLLLTGTSCGVDYAFGWSDLFLFSTGEEMLSIELEAYNDDGELNEVVKFSPKDVDGNDVKGKGFVIFDGRLWVFNNNVLWYSVKENCYDFSAEAPEINTSAGYIEFAKHITAIYPYLGTLAVFHSDSSSLVKINSDYSYSLTDESPGGCASERALVFHGTELYFYDDTKKGVFSFSQVVNGDKTLGRNIALDVQDELMSIDITHIDDIKTLSIVGSDKNEIWFLLPINDENYSTILIYDYIHSCWVKRKSQKLTSLAIIDNVFYSAGKNKVFEEYTNDTFDGEFIEAFYCCSPFNLSADNTMKILYIPPRLTLDSEYVNDFMVRYVKNYDSLKNPKIKHIKTKNMKNLFYWDISYWDSFVIFKPKEFKTTSIF